MSEELQLADAPTSDKPSRRSKYPKGDIIDLYLAGKSRGEISRELQVPYQTVYLYTKGLADNGTTKHRGPQTVVVLPNGMKRTDYCRQQFAMGRSRSEIAAELGISYQYVWQATRKVASTLAEAADQELGAAATASASDSGSGKEDEEEIFFEEEDSDSESDQRLFP